MPQQVDWGSKPTAKKTATPAPTLDNLVAGKGAMKRLNANIPDDVHADFKATVARKKLDMTEVLTQLVTDWNEKNRD